MTEETPEEARRRLIEETDARLYEQVNKRGEPHRGRSFEYEKLAVEYSHRAFQLLTYLNGGALVAIPTALAFFRADVGRSDVLLTAGAFVAGLILVLLAQGCAFFVMAARAEASMFSYGEQFNRAVALQIRLNHRPTLTECLRRATITSQARSGWPALIRGALPR